MTTFVTNDPHSGTNTALNKAIENPGTSPEKWRRKIINLESQVNQHRCIDDITKEICQ